MKDCRECRYAQQSYSMLLCMAMNIPKPTSFMRDDLSECGLKAALFEPKTGVGKYSDQDDE